MKSMPSRARCHTGDSFEVRPSTIPGAGLGLFAYQPIALEETIGYYAGHVLTQEELWHSPYTGSDYLLYICHNHIIVGEGPQANYTRYINHSENPNAYLIVSTRWKSARFEAIADIAPGDEIFFNYGDIYWPQPTPQPG